MSNIGKKDNAANSTARITPPCYGWRQGNRGTVVKGCWQTPWSVVLRELCVTTGATGLFYIEGNLSLEVAISTPMGFTHGRVCGRCLPQPSKGQGFVTDFCGVITKRLQNKIETDLLWTGAYSPKARRPKAL